MTSRKISFQLLDNQVEVSVQDPELLDLLDYLRVEAEQPFRPDASLTYEVTGRGPYLILERGQEERAVERPEDVLYVLYQRCYESVIGRWGRAGWAMIHGALLSVAGRRMLMIGSKASGKTTLALRLLYDGHAVEGDESVLVRHGEAVSLPRNFHVKPATPGLVPELAGNWTDWPAMSAGPMLVTGFSPARAGFAWRIEQGPIDATFVLRANHGGPPSCRPLAPTDTVAAAVENCLPTGATAAEAVRACCALLGGREGFELTVGNLRATADLLVAHVMDCRPGDR